MSAAAGLASRVPPTSHRRRAVASSSRKRTTVSTTTRARAVEDANARATTSTPPADRSLSERTRGTERASDAARDAMARNPLRSFDDAWWNPSTRALTPRRVASDPVPPVRLLTCYDETVDVIVREVDATRFGDRVEFCVYVLEPGASARRVLDAFRRAAARGVRVDASVDCSVVSAFTRWCEGTESWARELKELEDAFPKLVRFAPREQPTHAKYLMCHRLNALPTAVFGGVNIGDRFRPWRDFAIRAEGRAAVGALAMRVNGPAGGAADRVLNDLRKDQRGDTHDVRAVRDKTLNTATLTVGSRDRNAVSDKIARAGGVKFITNTPTGFDVVAYAAPWARSFPGSFDVLPALMKLMRDERYDEFIVAAAYVDGAGVKVLEMALERGCAMTLVMPRNPNVYHDANRKALKALEENHSARNGNGGRLRAYLCDDMLHAKVFLGRNTNTAKTSISRGIKKDRVAMLGSCNLKRRSFGQFAELNALVSQPTLCAQLEAALETLVRDSAPVTDADLAFAEPKATIEEWLG